MVKTAIGIVFYIFIVLVYVIACKITGHEATPEGKERDD